MSKTKQNLFMDDESNISFPTIKNKNSMPFLILIPLYIETYDGIKLLAKLLGLEITSYQQMPYSRGFTIMTVNLRRNN